MRQINRSILGIIVGFCLVSQWFLRKRLGLIGAAGRSLGNKRVMKILIIIGENRAATVVNGNDRDLRVIDRDFIGSDGVGGFAFGWGHGIAGSGSWGRRGSFRGGLRSGQRASYRCKEGGDGCNGLVGDSGLDTEKSVPAKPVNIPELLGEGTFLSGSRGWGGFYRGGSRSGQGFSFSHKYRGSPSNGPVWDSGLSSEAPLQVASVTVGSNPVGDNLIKAEDLRVKDEDMVIQPFLTGEEMLKSLVSSKESTFAAFEDLLSEEQMEVGEFNEISGRGFGRAGYTPRGRRGFLRGNSRTGYGSSTNGFGEKLGQISETIADDVLGSMTGEIPITESSGSAVMVGHESEEEPMSFLTGEITSNFMVNYGDIPSNEILLVMEDNNMEEGDILKVGAEVDFEGELDDFAVFDGEFEFGVGEEYGAELGEEEKTCEEGFRNQISSFVGKVEATDVVTSDVGAVKDISVGEVCPTHGVTASNENEIRENVVTIDKDFQAKKDGKKKQVRGSGNLVGVNSKNGI